MGGLVEFGQGGGGHHGDRVPAVGAEVPAADGGAHREFEGVVVALGGAAGVTLLRRGGVGLVAPGAHRGGDGFEVGAGLGVEQPRESGHAVGALRAQAHRPPPCSVFVGEGAVGVEVVADALPQPGQHRGVQFGGVLDEDALSLGHVGGCHGGWQHIEGVTDHPQVVLAERAGLDRAGHHLQLGRQRRAGERAARPDPGRHPKPPRHLPGGDP
ncbi:hypothetical protein A9X00_28505 [Mycobacterium sp. 1245805.9]|nr:hypothetical protein A9X00_28505 [Mycobacterium sp. 1245805.9]